MKKKMPSEGLRLGRDSGSILCDTLKKVAFSDSLGGVQNIRSLMSKVVFTDKFAVDFRAFTLAKLIFLERKLPRMNREFS